MCWTSKAKWITAILSIFFFVNKKCLNGSFIKEKYPVSIETSVLKRGRSIYLGVVWETEVVEENDNRKDNDTTNNILDMASFGVPVGPYGSSHGSSPL